MKINEKKIINGVTEPAWLKEVAQTSYVNIKDIARMFDIKPTTLDNLILRGEFPEADLKSIRGTQLGEYSVTNKRLWRVITIRKYFKENRENGNS